MVMGRDRRDNAPRAWLQTPRQPTAYLVEVTSLSPGLPPQRLPGERDPQHGLNPEWFLSSWALSMMDLQSLDRVWKAILTR
jgi:hypothetical protein